MFYSKYVLAEIFRRRGRTLTTVLGLGLASAVIIVIISFSQALSSAQATVLNPLRNVGTDLMVTRAIDDQHQSSVDRIAQDEYIGQNAVDVDLSKLGAPGSKFSNDVFTPGTLLTFDQHLTSQLNAGLISGFAPGLILNITHREGTVPRVSVTVRTGGDKIPVTIDIPPLTAAEQNAATQATQRALEEIAAKGLTSKSPEGAKILNDALNAATPARFRSATGVVTTPQHDITQDVGSIQTDIKTQNYTVAGVDTTKPAIGLILPSQVVKGAYFNGPNQVILSKSFADKNKKQVGQEVTLKDVKFKIVGIVEPELYTNVTDYYLPLDVLQHLAGKDGRVNLLLVKGRNAGSVNQAGESLKGLFPGAVVVSSRDTADKVSGGLRQAADLTNKFIGLMGLIVVIVACVITALLTISAINKRTREIGMLKAIGWSKFEVVRQITLENLLLGCLGAIVGIGLGLGATFLLNQHGISFDATIRSLNSSFDIVPGDNTAPALGSINRQIRLAINPQLGIILLGAGVALFGSVVAGLIGALKVSRLKPQEALRSLE